MIIWSGGQTGVDRAAWDAAIAVGLEQNGWVPKGKLAEDGPIPDHYCCQETDSTNYAVRTEKNLLEADATLIVAFGPMKGGTLYTSHLCTKHNRPHIIVDLDSKNMENPKSFTTLRARAIDPSILNVAGPRGSYREDVYPRVLAFLIELFKELT